MSYPSASEVMIHKEALYQVYVPLPFFYLYMAHYSALKRIFGAALQTTAINALSPFLWRREHNQVWAQGSFVEAEVKAERSRQRRSKAAMSLIEARQCRGRELEAEARQTKFEARPRQGDPLKKPSFP